MNSTQSLRALSLCATAAIASFFLPATASAVTVVGGSDLLSPADAAQLQTWLGKGPLKLTNIFDKAAGSTPMDFHAAADGKGATFSLIEYVGIYGGAAFNKPVLVGGYNPQSWSSGGGYNITPLDADRTAFVFNLKQGLKFDQRKNDGAGNAGQYQTFNVYDYGPSFGGGSDLNAGVAGNLNVGYSFLNSYGSLDDVGRDIARYPRPSRNRLQVGQIEVFTISIVPEPETWALMLAGLGLLGFAARRRA